MHSVAPAASKHFFKLQPKTRLDLNLRLGLRLWAGVSKDPGDQLTTYGILQRYNCNNCKYNFSRPNGHDKVAVRLY